MKWVWRSLPWCKILQFSSFVRPGYITLFDGQEKHWVYEKTNLSVHPATWLIDEDPRDFVTSLSLSPSLHSLFSPHALCIFSPFFPFTFLFFLSYCLGYEHPISCNLDERHKKSIDTDGMRTTDECLLVLPIRNGQCTRVQSRKCQTDKQSVDYTVYGSPTSQINRAKSRLLEFNSFFVSYI